jgi:hypothetical protein
LEALLTDRLRLHLVAHFELKGLGHRDVALSGWRAASLRCGPAFWQVAPLHIWSLKLVIAGKMPLPGLLAAVALKLGFTLAVLFEVVNQLLLALKLLAFEFPLLSLSFFFQVAILFL